jgi:hypothetical protein
MWMATMWRNNAVMCVTVPYNKVLFSILYFLTSQSEFEFGIALVRELIEDDRFEDQLSEVEKDAWKSFRNVTAKFFGKS